jgi:hypothetical protein
MQSVVLGECGKERIVGINVLFSDQRYENILIKFGDLSCDDKFKFGPG